MMQNRTKNKLATVVNNAKTKQRIRKYGGKNSLTVISVSKSRNCHAPEFLFALNCIAFKCYTAD